MIVSHRFWTLSSSQALTQIQKDLVATCRQEILGDVEAKSPRKRRVGADRPLTGVKRKITTAVAPEHDDDVDTDATEDIVTQQKRPKRKVC